MLISRTRKETISEACQATLAISTTFRRELASSSFPLQGKTPKKIRAILTETLPCFLRGRAKDLSAPLYFLLVWWKFYICSYDISSVEDVARATTKNITQHSSESAHCFCVCLCCCQVNVKALRCRFSERLNLPVGQTRSVFVIQLET